MKPSKPKDPPPQKPEHPGRAALRQFRKNRERGLEPTEGLMRKDRKPKKD